MKHCFAEQVQINFDKKLLDKQVEEIVKRLNLFQKKVPISRIPLKYEDSLFEILGIQRGQAIADLEFTEVITIACLQPFQTSAIHKDSDSRNNPTKMALNIPITSCKNVFMNWYEIKPNAKEKKIIAADGHVISGLSKQDALCVFSFACESPFLVNPTTFHDIVNTNNEYNIIISVR